MYDGRMRRRYILRCPHCGAPIADTVTDCPYCGARRTVEALGMHGGLSREGEGGLRVGDGAHLVVGSTGEVRECPFCGSQVAAGETSCAHCGNKVVIERLELDRLVVSGGSVTIGPGGSMTIGGSRGPRPIHEAARSGDVGRVQDCINGGDDVDSEDDDGRQPLHHAASAGRFDVARFLVAMGADPGADDSSDATPADVAAAAGHDAVADWLRQRAANR